MPLDLFRIRTFTVSVIAMFLAAFGFFAAIVFLPRWFQTVAGASATESGYNILPLLAGLIFSAVASGQIVARTGRYKVLIVRLARAACRRTLVDDQPPRRHAAAGAVALDARSSGLGIGPSFAVFTLIVQNSVPPAEVGRRDGAA